ITCADDVIVNVDANQCYATVNLGTPATSDNCGVASVVNDYAGNTFPVGTTAVTWTVTDVNGNTATCTQNVIVTDNIAPVITCADDVIVNVDANQCYATVNLGTPATSDNCGVASVVNDYAGNTFPVGTTAVTWTVTDVNGNTA